MSGSIAYDFDINQEVFVIEPSISESCAGAVRKAKVKRVRIELLVSGPQVLYDIHVSKTNGVVTYTPDDVFADLPTALTEYSTRVSST